MTQVPSALIVKYSCVCGLEKVECAVPLRGAKEDILEWMKEVGRILSADHARRRPDCHPQSLKEVMIPMDKEGGPIGGPVIR